MTPYETLNVWLPEELPLYQKYKDLNYKQVDTGYYEIDKTFIRAALSIREFESAPVLYDLMQKYKMMAKIFMLEPNTTYNWHADAFRFVAFNCLLTPDDDNYLTLFCNDISRFESLYFKTKRLVYEPRRFYLFNTQVPHIVTNYSDKARYLLTIAPYVAEKIPNDGKAINRDFSYFLNLVNELKEQGLIG